MFIRLLLIEKLLFNVCNIGKFICNFLFCWFLSWFCKFFCLLKVGFSKVWWRGFKVLGWMEGGVNSRGLYFGVWSSWRVRLML